MITKFIFKFVVFACLVGTLCYLALHINPKYENEYVAAIAPKLQKLKAIKIKKIVIIGGSNASFGIDSNLMQESLGIPVVNMALHGGLPLKFTIEQVKRYLNKGDILILSKEYSGIKDQYWSKMSGIELPKIVTYDFSQLAAILNDRELFESTTSGIFNTIKSYIIKYPFKNERKNNSVYSLEAFDGDNLKEEFIIGSFDKKIEPHKLPKITSNLLLINELSSYNKFLKDKGVEFYLTPPVIIEGYYENEEIEIFMKSLSNYTGIPLLNKQKVYTYKKKYFFNSHYHTNKQGRRIRTNSLIEDITLTSIFKFRKKSKPFYITNRDKLNKANLKMFDKMSNFEIKTRYADSLIIKPLDNLTKNYFRIQFKNENLKGSNFYLKLRCSPELIKEIRFKGIGNPEKFDSIIETNNYGEYELWKKLENVFFTDNNSYLGITLLGNKSLINQTITIKDVGVYEYLGGEDLVLDAFKVSAKENNSYYFKIITESQVENVSKVINNNETLTFKTNHPYKLLTNLGKSKIVDFYNNDVHFETKGEILFESNPKFATKIFKYKEHL
tara:strand:+ start:1130 stop:2797 length:1668 start_codon:yes stop_codon:yes gene_type:complete